MMMDCVLQKGTKNVLETGRTFATLFADMDLRLRLLLVRSEEEFKRLLWQHTKELAEEQTQMVRRLSTASGLGIGGVDIQPPDVSVTAVDSFIFFYK